MSEHTAERAAWTMRVWLASLPPAVQECARRWPPMSKFDKTRWVFGYEGFADGSIGLLLTTIPPDEQWTRHEEMIATKEIVDLRLRMSPGRSPRPSGGRN